MKKQLQQKPKDIIYYCWICGKTVKSDICFIACPSCGERKATISSTHPICFATIHQGVSI